MAVSDDATTALAKARRSAASLAISTMPQPARVGAVAAIAEALATSIASELEAIRLTMT